MNGPKEKGAERPNPTPKPSEDSRARIAEKRAKGKWIKDGRDFPLERLVDSLLAAGQYFEAGHLAAERLVADALLLRRLIYPSATAEDGE